MCFYKSIAKIKSNEFKDMYRHFKIENNRKVDERHEQTMALQNSNKQKTVLQWPTLPVIIK